MMEPRNHSPPTTVTVLAIFAVWCIFTGVGNPVNPTTTCSACGSSRSSAPASSSSNSPTSPPDGLSEAERAFRTDLVKLKILKALNLVEPPNVTTPLPDIPYDFEEMSFEKEKERKIPKASPIFLVGKRVAEGCERNSESVCYRFKKEGKSVCSVQSEKLWVFMHNNSNRMLDLLVLENHPNGSVQRIAKIDGHLRGWVSVHLHPWYMVGPLHDKSRDVCFSYDRTFADVIDLPINNFEDHIPLIEVTVEECSTHGQYRKRRSTNVSCTSMSTSNPVCCLQQFTVNFSRVGWNWIRRPPIIQANYCRGRCDFDASGLSPVTMNHRSLMYLSSVAYDVSNMMPCCVAVEKTHFHVLVYYPRNNSVVPWRIPGVSATACECY